MSLLKLRDLKHMRCIGEGGHGRVYEAYARDCLVAVKQISVGTTDQLQRALNEALISVPLRHPFVLHTLESFTELGNRYLVMKMAIGNLEPGQPNCILPLVTEALLGLEYLHHMGIYHGDLSLGNILRTRLGHIVISDFGLSVFKKTRPSTSSGSGAPTFPGIPANGEMRAHSAFYFVMRRPRQLPPMGPPLSAVPSCRYARLHVPRAGRGASSR
jgi:serine/threonine protein kinase